MLISGVSFRQRSLSQSQESDVLSYSERKIAKNFQGFAPEPHWGGLTAPPQTPRLSNGFSPGYTLRKTGTPKKLLDAALLFHDEGPYHIETSPVICSANQWTGVYMIEISVMKELIYSPLFT